MSENTTPREARQARREPRAPATDSCCDTHEEATNACCETRESTADTCGETHGRERESCCASASGPTATPSSGATCSADGGGCGCEATIIAFDGTRPEYIRRLWMVIVINATMFLVEMFGGMMARSQALKADALDFLGDTLTYGMSLAVIGKPLRLRASVAMVKGVSLFAMGMWVLGNTLYHTLILQTPAAPVMGAIAFAALAANLASVLLLLPYKDGDANVRSVWLCSRNDAYGNLGVIAASWLVWLTGSAWPDIVVAFVMAALFTHSSWRILQQARAEFALSRGTATAE